MEKKALMLRLFDDTELRLDCERTRRECLAIEQRARLDLIHFHQAEARNLELQPDDEFDQRIRPRGRIEQLR